MSAPGRTLLLLVAGLSLGCAGPERLPDPDPAAVVLAWHAALHADRPREAYRLLAEEAREGLDEDRFVELYQRQRETLLAQADELLAVAREAPPAERARVRFGSAADAVEVELVRTREGWRVSRVLDPDQ